MAPKIAVLCSANPVLTLYGDGGVEVGFVDVAVFIAVASISKLLYA